MAHLLDKIFLCPKTGEPLAFHNGQLQSSKVKYVNVNGIPWIYKDPDGAMRHWQKKIADVQQYSMQQLDRLAEELKKPSLLKSTAVRLNALKTAHEKNLRSFAALLGDNFPSRADDEMMSVDRVPKQQSATAYHGTLFRDWSWGREQIRAYGNLLEGGLKSKKRFAYLGAGACGLPLELHNRIKPSLSVALDINPLLMIPVRRMLDGESIDLVEFPKVAVDSMKVAVDHKLRLSEEAAPGFELVFCDAQNLPVRDGAFDAVVTSWFIDIVPRDFRELARLINVVLEDDGVWSNIGQLGFEKNDLSQIYGPDEIQEILKDSGFEILSWRNQSLPYLQSPYDSVGRQDHIWIFECRKCEHVRRPTNHEYWPVWLSDLEQPIPMDDEMRAFKVKAAVYSMVVEKVDGKASLREIADQVAKEFSLPPPEALRAVQMFFTNYYEGIVFREF